jgi:hypothetical protein
VINVCCSTIWNKDDVRYFAKNNESLLSDLEVPPFLDDVAIVSLTEENYIAKVGKVLHRLTYEVEYILT